MAEKNKKITELNVAIGLAAALLVVIMVIFLKAGQNKTPVSKEVDAEKKTVVSEPEVVLHEIREVEEPEFKKEKLTLEEKPESEEDLPQAVMLKDLPLDSISTEETRSDEEIPDETVEGKEAGKVFELQPSLEDIKVIKKRGLIIY